MSGGAAKPRRLVSHPPPPAGAAGSAAHGADSGRAPAAAPATGIGKIHEPSSGRSSTPRCMPRRQRIPRERRHGSRRMPLPRHRSKRRPHDRDQSPPAARVHHRRDARRLAQEAGRRVARDENSPISRPQSGARSARAGQWSVAGDEGADRRGGHGWTVARPDRGRRASHGCSPGRRRQSSAARRRSRRRAATPARRSSAPQFVGLRIRLDRRIC